MFFNPYIAGNPIGDQNRFFGREDIFREVMQVLRYPKGNAIVLYGQGRIGKTSVLLELERQLAKAGEFTPVYFDLQDKAGKPLSAVLYELAQRIAVVVGQEMPQEALFDVEGHYFQHTFLPQAANNATKGGLVLLFDEFDVLDNPKQGSQNTSQVVGDTFFPYLRSWMSKISRVQFVFVIGHRPEELSINPISTLKRIRATRISLLDHAVTLEVVRQSEQEGSLSWPDSAANRVWEWTQGHPYLTQLLCSVVWENIYKDKEEDEVPQLTSDHIDQALDQVLQQGANTFYWIWDGLPPAERVVIAAMAEEGDTVITDEKLVEILNRSGVRLIIRQLKLAPETLVQWDLLRPVERGYQFIAPLLRHWVSRNCPLRRVKKELDDVEPAAKNSFQTGQFFYRAKQFKDAEDQLRKALQLNPNHLKAQLLLGQLLLEDGRISESVQVLEEAYLYDAGATRADLIRALLASADGESEAQQVAIYKRILALDPNQTVAKARLQAIQEAQRKREQRSKLKIAPQDEPEKKKQETIQQSQLAEIRKRLNIAFDDVELSGFCLDYFPKVYDKFSQGMRKDYKITLLLDHCLPPSTDSQTLLNFINLFESYAKSSVHIEGSTPHLVIPSGKSSLGNFSPGAITNEVDNAHQPSDLQSFPINPFIYIRALAPNEFLGRKRVLRDVFGRLVTSQSTAIIGTRKIGKTSLLTYIADAETRGSLFKNLFDDHLFCFLDGKTLHEIGNSSEFWLQALRPLVDKLSSKPSHPLVALYRTAKQNEFGIFVLQQLFERMDKAGWRLVLLLDEFDAFLTNPVLHKAKFYGGLGSLASRFRALILLIASRRELEQLNQRTQEINPHGSPYFNVFIESHLGPLSNDVMEQLLEQGTTFKPDDRQFVSDMSGRHPYLAQTAAAMLWDVYADGQRGEKGYVVAGKRLYPQAKRHFADSWKVWTNETRRAVIAVLLLQMPDLAAGRQFQLGNLDDFTAELERLTLSGLVERDDKGEWHVIQYAFLSWLVNQLSQNVRDQTDFTIWLQRQTIGGVLTRGQQESLDNAIKQLLSYV